MCRKIVGYDHDGDAEYEDDNEEIRQLWSDFENTLGKIDYGFIEAKFVPGFRLTAALSGIVYTPA